jgi:hypothetical protein
MINETYTHKTKGRPKKPTKPDIKLTPRQLHELHAHDLDLDHYGLLYTYDRTNNYWRMVAPYCLECGHRISKTDESGKHLALCRKISNEEDHDPYIIKDGNINYKVWNPYAL